jgi:redox-sensitive bicupin YhaK (pirin superfamily)
MIRYRSAAERGHTRLDWLDSRHTFSFGSYFDEKQIGFRKLRVINDDRVAAGAGFGTHGHRNMEIVTLVLSGALEHADSLGHGSVLRPGEVQAMSAGKGIRHSEFNHSSEEPVHFLQIWIEPAELGMEPTYQQAEPKAWNGSPWRLLAHSHDPRSAVTIHQDAELWQGKADPDGEVEYILRPGRGVWLQVLEGSLQLARTTLAAGDGAAIEDESSVRLTAGEQGANFLLFDLA